LTTIKNNPLAKILFSVTKKTPITALRSPQKWSFTKSKLPFWDIESLVLEAFLKDTVNLKSFLSRPFTNLKRRNILSSKGKLNL